MRKIKTIKIDGREIRVKELRVKDIRRLLDQAGAEDFSLARLGEALPMATDLAPADIDDMAPSEIKVLWEAFREVNAVFFDLAARAGIAKTLAATLRQSLTEAFADLSSADTPTP